jgi:hypothetical protein
MDIALDVGIALAKVPVNVCPLISDTDFKTRMTSIAYNSAGMSLTWNFVDTQGNYTQTAVTPTTGGNYNWLHQGGGMYSIAMPAAGGASINNNASGVGWFTGIATGVLPWVGPRIAFRAANINNSLLMGTAKLQVDLNQIAGSNVSGGTGGLPIFGVVDRGTAQAVTTNTIQLRAALTIAANVIVGSVVYVSNATTGVSQSAVITAYNASTNTATLSPAWEVTPTGTIEYLVFAAPRAPTDSAALPTVSVADLTAAALAKFFTQDSGVLYAGAVNGSVVKEIGAQTGGAAPSASTVAAAVWNNSTRTLSAGTNIALAKGTGITGFNDLDSTAVQAAAAAALTAYDPPTKAEMDAGIAPLATAAGVTSAVSGLATSAGLTSAVAPLATAAGVTSAVSALATSSQLTSAVAPLATTAQLAPLATAAGVTSAISALATTAQLNSGLAPIATTAQLNAAVAPLATASGLTSAVAPLATSAGVTSAVTPLATAAGLTSAVAPLATTTQLNNAVSPLATTSGVASAVAPLATASGLASAVAPLATASGLSSLATTAQLNSAVSSLATSAGLASVASSLISLLQAVAALNDVSVSEILTTQMGESYAANGTAPTLAQAIFAIHQHLMSFEFVGANRVVKRLNGTTAFTEVLNDATTPTGLTR